MTLPSPIAEHRYSTYTLAGSLDKNDVYQWLLVNGYFPESYVLPPCFYVAKKPRSKKPYYVVTRAGSRFTVTRTECVNVPFPKSEYTDRTYGIIHPYIHHDIAYHISQNWQEIVDAMIPHDSRVTSYSFPVPIDLKTPGRLSYLRSGRMIYEFINMTDDDIASVAYQYSYLVKTDIKSFYPSIYTHSIAWALHEKEFVRRGENVHDYNLLGNRLDKLFQNASDGCTNGIPIGPVVSDIVSEIVASAVDRIFTRILKKKNIDCEAVRFKDDYRILIKSESEAKVVIKSLQAALKEYNLELNDEKTMITKLPDGLFREWVSKYHSVYPKKLKRFSWKEFRELYLAVISIDSDCPGTGVIDRFLADIVTTKGRLKLQVRDFNLEKVISMLLMLATLRPKAFPKILAVIEVELKSPFGIERQNQVVEYLESYLQLLSEDEERNSYLISWIGYFLVSNGLLRKLKIKPRFVNKIIRSIFNNKGAIFNDCKEFELFVNCRLAAKDISMIEYLDIFDPPQVS